MIHINKLLLPLLLYSCCHKMTLKRCLNTYPELQGKDTINVVIDKGTKEIDQDSLFKTHSIPVNIGGTIDTAKVQIKTIYKPQIIWRDKFTHKVVHDTVYKDKYIDKFILDTVYQISVDCPDTKIITKPKIIEDDSIIWLILIILGFAIILLAVFWRLKV